MDDLGLPSDPDAVNRALALAHPSGGGFAQPQTGVVDAGLKAAQAAAPSPFYGAQPEKPADPMDFTTRYNTTLPPEQQAAYQKWVSDQSAKVGRDVGGDAYDYDLQGWFKDNGPQDLSGAHLTDAYKKPNHPTFSNQSQYNGTDGYQGGVWEETPEGTRFTPGLKNLYSPEDLQAYFKKYEPSNQLILPQGFGQADLRKYADGGDVTDAPTAGLVDAGLKAAQAASPAPAPDQSYRGSFLPISRDAQGSLHFDPTAGILGQLWGAATLPGDVYTGKTDPNSDEGFARAQGLAGMMTGGTSFAPAEADALNMGIRAYHGSPHDFDRFDVSKIGTGEGAQVYGHGLYFAENPAVAESYQTTLASHVPQIDGQKVLSAPGTPEALATQYLDDAIRTGSSDPFSSAISRMMIAKENSRGADKFVAAEQTLRDWDAMGAKLVKGGRMYNVDLGVDPQHLLDWDSPLPTRHPARDLIHDVASPSLGAIYGNERNVAKNALMQVHNENLTGNGAYNTLTRAIEPARDALKQTFGERALFAKSSALASEMLNSQGIPGIRYLDQGSRMAGDGSRNYVMFDDKPISILRKYADGGDVPGGQHDPVSAALHLAQSAAPYPY